MVSWAYSPSRVRSRAHPYAVITVPAGGNPVEILPDVKSWLKLDVCDDRELEILVRAAQAAFEKYTKLTLFTTEFSTRRDCFGQDWELRRGPIQSITRLEYRSDNVLTPVDPAIWFLHKKSEHGFGYAALYENQCWPDDADRQKDAIEIDFEAGFGTNWSEVPQDIRLAVLYTVADSYSNRGDCGGGSGCGGTGAFGLSAKAMAIADYYRILDFGGPL